MELANLAWAISILRDRVLSTNGQLPPDVLQLTDRMLARCSKDAKANVCAVVDVIKHFKLDDRVVEVIFACKTRAGNAEVIARLRFAECGDCDPAQKMADEIRAKCGE